MSMEAIYKAIGISRQAVWKHNKKMMDKQSEEVQILSIVIDWRLQHPKMGSRQVFHGIKSKGINLNIGINKFERLLKKNNLNVGKVKSKKPLSSDGKGKDEKYSNLTNGLVLTDINQLVVVDITYYWVDAAWHYIFCMKDVYSQRVIEIIASDNMETSNALLCLKSLIKLRGVNALIGCIHHSDNGSQYNANEYKKLLIGTKMLISRAERCEQNGSAEQLNHICKNMYFEAWGVTTFKELKQAVKKFKYLNNKERPIKQLGNISPEQFEKLIENIPLESRIKKVLHDFKI